MQNNIYNFTSFINEASLRGNIGIPGEEGSGKESWLDKITRRSDSSAQEFAQRNLGDIRNFMQLVNKSQSLQSGYEDQLSKLTEVAIREVFGTLLDDVDLDIKIVTRQDVKMEMDETPDTSEPNELEELLDEDIINQIHKRKILRTIQQGKGLNVKAILNLSIFKEGLIKIMGEERALEYLTTLNKVSNVAQFFDWTTPEEVQRSMWQTRSGFSGSSKIEFPKETESADEDTAEEVINGLIDGEDITQNPAAEELLGGLNTRVVARGVDLSVLIHEAIKGIYMLVTQAALESLYGESAEKVIMNTDTLFDELQELKFGRQMQEVLFKQVSNHPIVLEKLNRMISQNYSDTEIAAFQEQLNFLFFGKIALLGQDNAKEMLTLVNEILSETSEATELCDPLIKSVIKDLEQEEEYQASRLDSTIQIDNKDEISSKESPEELKLSKEELNNAIIDAYSKGDMEEVDRLRKYLGESICFPRISLAFLKS